MQELVKAVLERERHGGASLAQDGPCEATIGRVRLLGEMEAAFFGTVEITAVPT